MRLDKPRPALILAENVSLYDVQIIPITRTQRHLLSEVVVGAESGLNHASYLNAQLLMAVAPEAFIQHIGALGDEKMNEVCRAVKAAIGR